MQAVFRIRGYDSFEQIAVGGMAVVYKARRQSLKKTVAIKVLLPHLAADAHFINRFQQEAEAAARVQHDNIVNVIDYGKSENSHYIVMEYYDGLTVEELLRAQPRLPVDIALAIVLNVCYGLEAAHAAGLVHRDVKPANIIFTRQGGIKVADFGLAKAVDRYTLVTQTGKVVGTPAYMSPEQTRGEAVGTPSDIFSLGVVAYELMGGRRPFDGSSYSEVVDRIQCVDPPLVGTLNPLVETPFEQIVKRMLAKRVEERYRAVDEVIRDLETLMDAQGLRRDRRALSEFFADPAHHTETVHRAILERLSGETPPASASDRGRQAAIRHYQKILYLDPGDEGAKHTLKKLGAPDPASGGVGSAEGSAVGARRDGGEVRTDGEYKVVLESIDRRIETPDSFALKLSMRMKSPVPRMRSLVARAPCTVAQRLTYKKAKWLESVITDLGGNARVEEFIEPVEVAAAQPEAPAPNPDAGARARPDRRASSGGIVCPRCGWEEEADARFCSLCLCQFNKTDKIDVRALQRLENEGDNPLAAEGSAGRSPWQHLPGAPGRPLLLYLGAGGILLVVLAIIVATRH